MNFLPMTIEEIRERNIEQLDFILVSGDAYVDHPSFGTAVIGRILESKGFTIGIIAQPNWNNINSFGIFGKPKYSFLVTSGNIDSMVNHYSVAKKRRSKDIYSPKGEMGLRPDRATTVYSNKIRELYRDIPIVLGGIEASLRRLSHYDYWSDSVRRSCLMDSGADLLVYGMGERQIIEIAEAFKAGKTVAEMTTIKGTVYKTKEEITDKNIINLPTYNEVLNNKKKYSESFKIQFQNTDNITAKTLVEKYGNVFIVQNPPAPPLEEAELDSVYSLNFMRRPHPVYDELGGIAAVDEVKFSITSNRGCFGSCNFCALTFHQGRTVTARSHKSIVNEAQQFVHDPEFKGYIHDVGGPTANFRAASCKQQSKIGVCKNKMCMTPSPCKSLEYDHKDYLKLLRKLREIPKVKKVFIRSGIRYDYLINDKNNGEFFDELVKHHISGQLKVAPEHVSAKVLKEMGKPTVDVYNKFIRKYEDTNKKFGMNQFVVPYLMSSHPGSDLNAAIELAEYLRSINFTPEQVQDFYPTPATLSTCVYYTGFNPLTNEEVYVPRSLREKAMQRALIQYRLPQNYDLVYSALQKAERQDLIGFGKHCLIRPRSSRTEYSDKKPTYNKNKVKQETKPIKRKTIRNTHKKK